MRLKSASLCSQLTKHISSRTLFRQKCACNAGHRSGSTHALRTADHAMAALPVSHNFPTKSHSRPTPTHLHHPHQWLPEWLCHSLCQNHCHTLRHYTEAEMSKGQWFVFMVVGQLIATLVVKAIWNRAWSEPQKLAACFVAVFLCPAIFLAAT